MRGDNCQGAERSLSADCSSNWTVKAASCSADFMK